MKPIVLRNLDDDILQKLKQARMAGGRTPEEMAKRLLIEAVRTRASRRHLGAVEVVGLRRTNRHSLCFA
jgi:plasmid stability protein